MFTRVGILGAGFGLYGYAVTLDTLGSRLVTLQRYRDKVLSRSDLRHLDSNIEYVSTTGALLESRIDALVVARRPQDQLELVLKGGHERGIHLLLEKPVARSKQDLESLASALVERRQTFSVGYLFPYTGWYRWLRRAVEESREPVRIDVKWSISQIADHERNRSWKANKENGGGLASFYAIHFVPILAELGLEVDHLHETKRSLRISAVGKRNSSSQGPSGVREITLALDSAPPTFDVRVSSASHRRLLRLSSPFALDVGCEGESMLDERVTALSAYLHEVSAFPQDTTRKHLGYLGSTLDFMNATTVRGR